MAESYKLSQVEICAEIGQNHNGSIDLALQMVEAAKQCGVTLVKFQKRTVALAIPSHMKDVVKETPWGPMSYSAYRERLELSLSSYDIIDNACRRIGIPWFASVWDVPSLQTMVERYPNMPYVKVPSACLTDSDLLRAARDSGIPVILSTGMSTLEQIAAAVQVLDPCNLTLCHCNSTYPCPVEDLNLLCIPRLAELKECNSGTTRIGYSGHEVGLATTIAAVALGAQYVERHFTLDRSMWGTDQAASVEPAGFRRLVKDIRLVERALGDGVKQITPGELETMRRLRREA